MTGCSICAELATAAPTVVAAEEQIAVTHLAGESVFLGYLFVVTRRHVQELGDLSEDEAAAVGRAATRWSRALQTVTGADHVYAAVIGHHIPHFHLHLIPRCPGTPREFWWTRVDEWPGAPRGGEAEIAELLERLRAA
jgi:diadenosine tetraphosphate (Ap4A) HIT family hydrolase